MMWLGAYSTPHQDIAYAYAEYVQECKEQGVKPLDMVARQEKTEVRVRFNNNQRRLLNGFR